MASAVTRQSIRLKVEKCGSKLEVENMCKFKGFYDKATRHSPQMPDSIYGPAVTNRH